MLLYSSPQLKYLKQVTTKWTIGHYLTPVMSSCLTHTHTHTKLCTRKSPGVSVLLFLMRYDDGYLGAHAIIDAVL